MGLTTQLHHPCSSSSWLGARGPLLAIRNLHLDGGGTTRTDYANRMYVWVRKRLRVPSYGLASATALSNSAHEIDPSPSASSLLSTAPIFAIAAVPLPPTSCKASSVSNCLLALSLATRAGLLTCVCKIGAGLGPSYEPRLASLSGPGRLSPLAMVRRIRAPFGALRAGVAGRLV